MTLMNKTWLKQEVSRLFLSGESQENIAIQLNISVGTVNSLVNEIMKSDDTIDLQRQIAIISKKNGVGIPQIAVNLRWKNRIKQSALDDKKIEKFLDAMEIWCNKYSISPASLANQLFSIIEITLRENIEPHKLEEVIKLKTNELREINEKIDTSNKLLDETSKTVEEEQKRLKIKQKDLDQFDQISNLLELYNYPEISTEYGAVARALIDIKKMGYDAKDIVSKYEDFESLKKANEKLDKKLRESEKLLEHYRRMLVKEETRSKGQHIASEVFARLIKDGLKAEDIFNVAHILNNDFPQGEIKQLIEYIRTFGSIAAAKAKLEREYEHEFGFDYSDNELHDKSNI